MVRTQPTPTASTQPSKPPSRSELEQRPGCLRGFLRSPMVVAALAVLLGLLLVSAASAAVGWGVGSSQFDATATVEAALYMLDQYNLALVEMEQGSYTLARQRLDYIFAQNPNFLDVRQQLINVMVAMGGSGQPTAIDPLVPTATPTTDPRPKEELFTAAEAFINARDWTKAIDTLLALRKADPLYRTADVDGWMYAALRNRGAENITIHGLFEPGLYDFALAETFGPLDGQATAYREWARLYLYGNAFWLAYPQDAAYYYGQLVSLAPDLRDSNGVSAFGRYWQSLVHWADQLAADGEWCESYDQYQRAQAARNDGNLVPTANYALEQCFGPSETPSFTPVASSTFIASFTPSATGAAPASDTPTPSATTGAPSDTPMPSDTHVPSDTPTPTETPTP